MKYCDKNHVIHDITDIIDPLALVKPTVEPVPAIAAAKWLEDEGPTTVDKG